MDKNERRDKVKKFFMIFVPFFLVSMQIATQNVASDCRYDEILGWGIPVGDMKIYLPWMFFVWKSKFALVIPTIIASATRYVVLGSFVGFLIAVFTIKKMQNSSSYGSAKWATSRDIKESGLYGNKEGVMIGINPYRFKGYKDKNILNKLLRDDGPAHIGLFAPTRSGKGASIIVNTCLLWKNSLFVLDPKGENYNITASYRKKVLGQKIIKFAPFGDDGLGARWNPIAEVRMSTSQEVYDVMGLARMIADPTGKGGEKGDSHWIDTSAALIQTVILHLLYSHKREDLPIPTLTDISRFLSSTDKPFDDAIEQMQHYPHMSTDEFFHNNIFQRIYGNYIETNFMSFNESLHDAGIQIDVSKLRSIKLDILKDKLQKIKNDYDIRFEKQNKITDKKEKELKLNRLRTEYEEETNKVKVKEMAMIDKYQDKFRDITEIQQYYMNDFSHGMNFETAYLEADCPFKMLLTHPRVADGAAECANRDPKEQGSVLSSANAKFNLYRDPIVAKNTSCSDFTSTDILNPNEAVSIFLVIPPNKLNDASPLIRIFINYLLDKNTETMDFTQKNKQRCLLLLDEFPQLGKIEKMETGMAIIAGYGLKVLFVAQDINQVNKNYGENNSIVSNCHIRIIFTPNDLKTAENISKFLGKKTIEVTNKSEAGTFKTNRSYNQTGRELLAPDELAKMNKDDEIILVSGMAPIKAKKAWYFKIPYFTDRCKNDKFPLAEKLKSDTATVIDNYEALSKLCGLASTERILHKEIDKGKEILEEIQTKDVQIDEQKVEKEMAVNDIKENEEYAKSEPIKSTKENINKDFGSEDLVDIFEDGKEQIKENPEQINEGNTVDLDKDVNHEATDEEKMLSEHIAMINVMEEDDMKKEEQPVIQENTGENINFDLNNDDVEIPNTVPNNDLISEKDLLNNITSDNEVVAEKETSIDISADEAHEKLEEDTDEKININDIDDEPAVKEIDINPLPKDFSMKKIYEKKEVVILPEEAMINILCQRYNFDEKEANEFLLKMDTLVDEEKQKAQNNQLEELHKLEALVSDTVISLKKCNKILQKVA